LGGALAWKGGCAYVTGRHDKFFLGGVNGTVGQVHAN
jgi:hypothetical protein